MKVKQWYMEQMERTYEADLNMMEYEHWYLTEGYLDEVNAELQIVSSQNADSILELIYG